MNLNVVILAAGQGKRMMSDLPKVMQLLGGIPLLEHVLRTAQNLNPRKIQIVCGHQRHIVQAAFASYSVDWVEQREQHGTGHAVQQALAGCADDDRVLVLYGDVPLIRAQTLDTFLKCVPSDQVGLLVASVENPTGLGRIIRDDQKNVIAVVEDRDATPYQRCITEINTGITLCPAILLKKWLPLLSTNNTQHEYYLTDIIRLAVQEQGAVCDVMTDAVYEVQGVNHFWELAQLERYYQRECARKWADTGVKFLDFSRVDIRGGPINIGSDVVIDINVILEGRIKIGRHVSIGAHCILKDCEIEDFVTIEPYTFIDGAVIRVGSQVGPFSRLRSGTVLEKDSKVGNFVEMKNAHLGAQSKANHLSYLGDCDIGTGVNIGAGTITCNYDGVRKSQTIIESGAFIGSHTALVAPVIVREKATIGAGSVITKDAPAEQLTLSRAVQKTIRGWQRKIQ